MLAAARDDETTPPDANDGAVVEGDAAVAAEAGEPPAAVRDAEGSLNFGKVDASKRGGDACRVF